MLLSFSTPISSLFYTVIPQKWGHLGPPGRSSSDSDVAGSKCSHSKPFPPGFSFPFGKSTILFHIQELVGLLVSLERTINKRSNFFLLYFYSCLSIRAAISFDSSVARRLTWPNGLMNACIRTAYCYQNGMWGYAMHLRLRNDQEIKI